MGFFSKSVHDFSLQAKQYFQQKFYNSDFGDLLPLIAADAFEFQLIISASPRLQLRDCYIVKLFHCSAACLYIVLHLSQEHYSGTAMCFISTKNNICVINTSCYNAKILLCVMLIRYLVYRI